MDSLGSSTVDLLGRVRRGDSQALDRLCARMLGPLQRWASGRLPDWARREMDTNDLVQQTLVGTIRNLDAFNPRHPGALQAYLRRALLNRLRDELRRVKQRRLVTGSGLELADHAPSPIEQAIGSELLERYEQALTRLNPADTEAIISRVELRMSYCEIANHLGKSSADAARMAVTRALERLAREMAHD